MPPSPLCWINISDLTHSAINVLSELGEKATGTNTDIILVKLDNCEYVVTSTEQLLTKAMAECYRR